MDVLLVTHPAAYGHDAGWGHPERPERITAAIEGVHRSGLDVTEVAADRIDRASLELVHDPGYVDALDRLCRAGGGPLDQDTSVVTASWEAALRSAGSGPTALEALRDRPDTTAFVAMRPPGHHALRARAMGFCLFNNVAVAARSLTGAGRRVAIVDWDVHHGNGTQEMFYDDPDVLYVSFHQWPFYPGTGAIEESGTGAGAGTNVNFPWPAGTTGPAYHDAMERVVLPVLEGFAPDDLLVSAGYDAHRRDPLAGIRLESDDYGLLAAALRERLGAIRTVFFLEGGYDLEAITESVTATLRGTASALDGIGERVERHDVPGRTLSITDSVRARLAKWHSALR